ncbi:MULTISPECIES: hypothetical protein [Pseudomonas]|uniref:hypothetical protein n=1 Tax=Pseudomonas TaxID=286 RepID=UPI00235E5F4B|nr:MULTISPECIES: hypothetical protein [Pseudomonas]WJV24474.1 hypothetical protein PSR66_00010 [Pseudomonas chlororaphis]
MKKIATLPLDCDAAKRKLDALNLEPIDLPIVVNMLEAIDSASDRRHLDLIMAEASGLLRGLTHGLVLTPQQLVEVGMLFDAVAIHERAQMN